MTELETPSAVSDIRVGAQLANLRDQMRRLDNWVTTLGKLHEERLNAIESLDKDHAAYLASLTERANLHDERLTALEQQPPPTVTGSTLIDSAIALANEAERHLDGFGSKEQLYRRVEQFRAALAVEQFRAALAATDRELGRVS